MEKELQEKYMALQMIDTQIKDMEKQYGDLEQRKQDVSKMRESLEQFSKAPKADGFSVIGSGIFAPTKITDTEEVLVNIGSNIFTKKKIPEAIDLINDQIKQADDANEKIMEHMRVLIGKANQAQKELSGIKK